MFVDLQHKYLQEKSVGSASNIAPVIIQARSPRKIIIINPNEEYPSKDHFKHLTALVKMLSSDKFVKFIMIFSLEIGPDMDAKIVSKFNDQLDRFVSSLGIEYVKFIKVNLLVTQGMLKSRDSGAYMEYNYQGLIEPHLRVIFNLVMNYVCNGDNSILNMKSADTNCCV